MPPPRQAAAKEEEEEGMEEEELEEEPAAKKPRDVAKKIKARASCVVLGGCIARLMPLASPRRP